LTIGVAGPFFTFTSLVDDTRREQKEVGSNPSQIWKGSLTPTKTCRWPALTLATLCHSAQIEPTIFLSCVAQGSRGKCTIHCHCHLCLPYSIQSELKKNIWNCTYFDPMDISFFKELPSKIVSMYGTGGP
jgi:hypothetical protein